MIEPDNYRAKVAYQGERGAFSEMAAHSLLGADIETIPYRTFEEVFEAVSTGSSIAAIAPIENSLAGSVHKNYDLLVAHELTIVGEASLRIVHNLIATAGARLSDVRRIYSHPVALAQCERFLRANPQIDVAPAYDTAGSVKMIVERKSKDEAAIAGLAAAEAYGAQVIAEAIEDNAQNFTRFLLLARPESVSEVQPVIAATRRKTSIVFRVANVPGALFRMLAAFSLRDIDLAKIESRPIEGQPWEYSFYLDLIGDSDEPRVERALAHLAEMAESVRILGSYPSAGILS